MRDSVPSAIDTISVTICAHQSFTSSADAVFTRLRRRRGLSGFLRKFGSISGLSCVSRVCWTQLGLPSGKPHIFFFALGIDPAVVKAPMSKAGLYYNDSEASPTESSDTWFDRKLAELNADLARLEAALESSPAATTPPRPPAPKQLAKAPTPAKLAAAALPSPASAPPPPAPTPTPVPAIPAVASMPPPPAAPPPPLPTGTDLADPKNFGRLPPTADLERGSVSPEEYRQRLARHLAFATKVLHTSRVPAAVWREWRVFEKALHERLRILANTPG